MALSKSSKILIDDINTALSGKIDTAGTGLTKSGTSLALATCGSAGTAGPSANATLAYSGTFTVPYITYDAYGRVTGRTNMTMTMPAAPSGGSAESFSNFVVSHYDNCSGGSVSSGSYKFPSGGTYRYIIVLPGGYSIGGRCNTASGGSTVSLRGSVGDSSSIGFLVGARIS